MSYWDEVKSKMRDYKWNNPALKRKYNLLDLSAAGLVVGIFLLLKFVQGSMPYIWLMLLGIFGLEYYCFKIKAQDKKLKKGK